MTLNRATGPLPTLPGAVKACAMRRVAEQHPAWPARLILVHAVRTLENGK